MSSIDIVLIRLGGETDDDGKVRRLPVVQAGDEPVAEEEGTPT